MVLVGCNWAEKAGQLRVCVNYVRVGKGGDWETGGGDTYRANSPMFCTQILPTWKPATLVSNET